MLISVQVISKILATKDFSIVEDNLLDASYFEGYENEFKWINDFYNEYHKVPDDISFLDKFPDFELVEVTDSDRYLLETLREQHLYSKFTKVLPQVTELLKQDSEAAREFLEQTLHNELQPLNTINDIGVIESVFKRVEDSEYVSQNVASNYIPTGFDEIDADITGLQRGDELVVIVARINMGKSWVAEYIGTNAVKQGYKVGYFDPEMSVSQVGYRFDTLYGNVPNKTVLFGKYDEDFTIEDYKEYANNLKEEATGEMFITKPKTFNRKLTVSKLRTWIKIRQLDMVIVDGVTYLTDERYKKGDSKTISLTNISEDLMDLSSEMHLPVVIVVQANRGGVSDKNSLDTPELENIKDSDGIGANASKVYAVKQVKDDEGNIVLVLENKKSRTGEVGKQYKYIWDINTGKFEYKNEVDLHDMDEDIPVRRKKQDSTTGSAKKRGNVDDEF